MPNVIKYSTTTQTGALQKGNIALGISGSFGPSTSTGWYSSIPPTSGKYNIIETSVSGNPRVYCPQNDTELIKFVQTKGATGANTGSAAAALSWIATQSSLMAANIDYEGIVTDSLVLNLDAGFVGSYPTTDVTWYDLSGNLINGTLTNGPTFSSANSGSIVFDGIDDYVPLDNSAGQTSILSPSNITISIWFKTSNLTQGGNNLIRNRCYGYGMSISASNLNGFVYTNSNAGTAHNFSYNISANTWYNATFTLGNMQYIVYINGSQIYSVGTFTNNIYYADCAATPKIVLGRDGNYPSFYLNGQIATTQIYNRALSTAEVLQNYNAQKGRFGL